MKLAIVCAGALAAIIVLGNRPAPEVATNSSSGSTAGQGNAYAPYSPGATFTTNLSPNSGTYAAESNFFETVTVTDPDVYIDAETPPKQYTLDNAGDIDVQHLEIPFQGQTTPIASTTILVSLGGTNPYTWIFTETMNDQASYPTLAQDYYQSHDTSSGPQLPVWDSGTLTTSTSFIVNAPATTGGTGGTTGSTGSTAGKTGGTTGTTG